MLYQWRLILPRWLRARMLLAIKHHGLRYHGLRREQREKNCSSVLSNVRHWLLGNWSGHMPYRWQRILLQWLHTRMHLALKHRGLRYHELRREQRCKNCSRVLSNVRHRLRGERSGHMPYRWRRILLQWLHSRMHIALKHHRLRYHELRCE